MKKILFLTLSALMALPCLAAPVSQREAAQVANNFYHQALRMKGDLMPTAWEYDNLYLFQGAGGGFVIVSGDDRAKPILAYSAMGSVDVNDLPLQMAERMKLYSTEIDLARLQDVRPTAKDAAMWDRLRKGAAFKDVKDSIDPLLPTLWNQDGYYNTYCPAGTPTGCAATAQAQFMRYWNYPAFGNGNDSYNAGVYGVQSADFAHTLYDWANMPSQVTAASSDAEKEAVATLMYHVGVSLHMGYAPNGSGAAGLAEDTVTPCMNNSLKYRFHYDRNMRARFKFYGFTDEAWADSLMAELRLLHPILYCGVCPAGGHGFVCDGFRWQEDEVYFHFNFGWSGRGDGYYTVDYIAPNVSPTGEGGATYVFSQSNMALLGAVPDYQMHVSDEALSMMREGGEQRVLFSADSSHTQWTVSADQPWVRFDTVGVGRAGWVTIIVDENNSDSERSAIITFSQSGRTVKVQVQQTNYRSEDYCPLTVVMQSTNGNGWLGGAYLSFESLSGVVYGTASLPGGSEDTAYVNVAPHDVQAVFHNGGGTDRYINYMIYNHYGEELVNVTYAYRNGGTHFIEWPCVPVAIEDVESDISVAVYPNPASTRLHIQAEGLLRSELVDLNGRVVRKGAEELSLNGLSSGIYMVRTVTNAGVALTKIVKQ